MLNLEKAHSLPDEQQQYIQSLRSHAAEKIGPAMDIIGPWSDRLTSQERAVIHLELLAQTYGAGHPGSASTWEQVERRQMAGELLTWIVSWHEQPVGMVNLEIHGGIAEVVRSVEIPTGTPLPNGQIYHGEAKMSGAMYHRLADLLESHVAQDIWAIEGDIRLASEIRLPDGRILPAGVKTQHINATSGLCPLLLCVPRYQVHPAGGHPHQEAFLQSRKYVDDNSLDLEEPLYTPLPDKHYPLTLANIATSTYQYGWGIQPSIVEKGRPQLGAIELNQTAGIHYSTATITGDVDEDAIARTLIQGLEQSRFVEIILENNPDNILSQQRLLDLGVVPLGVFPGVKSRGVSTTLHYGIARPDIIEQMVEVELARDYQNTPIESLVLQLREVWRELGNNSSVG
jgi:hypothetical protein